ncbi:MAG: pyridoxal phosphate-dependent aminotransferase [Fibrobacterota bacterium]|nr:pyridoxal phosphate-dependent aminotransferase [Fibrobacterota bacterium]QQS06297.1 MAG: pyridoxal phosphate-dependent aminotransferase [Fibrobacterota bacterium]
MRFSRRSDNPAASGSDLALAMEDAKLHGQILYDLSLTDPTGWVERATVERKVLGLLGREEARFYRPDPQGLESARQVLANRYGGHSDQWYLCASTSEAYSLLFQLLLDPGDALAVCRPSYPLLDDLARHQGIRLVDIPLRWHGARWVLDIGVLESRLRQGVRCLALIQPGNPTGWWLSGEELEKLVMLCQRYDCIVVCDEVFADDLHLPGFRSLHLETRIPLFVLGGLSKSLGLPQLKLGWIRCASPDPVWLAQTRERLSRINDSLLSASTPVQLALEELFTLQGALREPLKRRCEENLVHLQDRHPKGWECLPAGGGWCRILRLDGISEEVVCKLLLECGTLVQPGYFFDLPWEAIVVSLLSEPSQFRSGLDALENVLEVLRDLNLN